MGILQTLFTVDFFSLNVNLRFKHKSQHKTPIGIFVSYLIIFFCVSAFYFFGRDVVQKKEPDVSSSQRGVSNPYPIDLGKEAIPLIFGLATSDFWEPYMDLSLYHFDIFFVRGNRDQISNQFNYTVQVVKPEPCDIEQHFSQTKFRPPETLIKNKYCLPEKSELLKEAVSGNFLNSNVNNFIQIRLSRCTEQNPFEQLDPADSTTTKATVCQSKEKIDERIQSSLFMIHAPSYFVDPKNLQVPFDTYYQTIYTTILTKSSKLLTVDFMKASLNTDESPIFKAWESESFFLMRDPVEFLTEQGEGSATLLEVNVSSAQEELFYYRRYKKVQNVMAEVGGFIKVIFVVSMFMMKPFIKMHFFTNLLNSVFKFKFRKIRFIKEGLNTSPEDIKMITIEQQHQKLQEKLASHMYYRDMVATDQSTLKKQNFKKMMFLQTTQNDMLKRITHDVDKLKIDQKADEKSQIHIQQYEYCLNFLPFYKHKEKKKLKQARNLILEKIDISFIVTKLIELQKLKYVLFSENQLKLFNFVPQPRINLEEEHDHLIMGTSNHFYDQLFQIQKPNNLKMIDAFQAFYDMSVRKELDISQQNQKLIALIDPTLLKIFEESKELLKEEQPDQKQKKSSNQYEDGNNVFGEPILKNSNEEVDKLKDQNRKLEQNQEIKSDDDVINDKDNELRVISSPHKIDSLINFTEEVENENDRVLHKMQNQDNGQIDKYNHNNLGKGFQVEKI